MSNEDGKRISVDALIENLEMMYVEYQCQSYMRVHQHIDINTYYTQVYKDSFLERNFRTTWMLKLARYESVIESE